MLFKEDFLDKLESISGANTMLDHYMNDLNLSFHDAVVKFANFHGVQPEYYSSNEKESNPDLEGKIRKLIEGIKLNGKSESF